ncbi:hypothetical protein D3C87_954100 [compost metagenome]
MACGNGVEAAEIRQNATAPALQETLEIDVIEIFPSLANRTHMGHDAFRRVDETVARLTDLHAELDVFVAVAIAFVEAPDLLEDPTGNSDASRGNALEIPLLVDERVGGQVGLIEPVAGGAVISKHNPGMLEGAVRKEQFASDGADLGLGLKHAEHAFQPPWMGNGVVVQEKQHLSVCETSALVASLGKAKIFLVAMHDDIPAQLPKEVRRAVGGGIVHEDDLIVQGFRSVLRQCLQARDGVIHLVVKRDDDRYALLSRFALQRGLQVCAKHLLLGLDVGAFQRPAAVLLVDEVERAQEVPIPVARHGGTVRAPAERASDALHVDEGIDPGESDPKVPVFMGGQRFIEEPHRIKACFLMEEAENRNIVANQKMVGAEVEGERHVALDFDDLTFEHLLSDPVSIRIGDSARRGFQGRNERSEVIRVVLIVVIEVSDVLSRRGLDTGVPRRGKALVSGMSDIGDPPCGRKLLDHVLGTHAGIVDDHDFEVLEGLSKHALDRTSQEVGTIESGDNDGN